METIQLREWARELADELQETHLVHIAAPMNICFHARSERHKQSPTAHYVGLNSRGYTYARDNEAPRDISKAELMATLAKACA